MASDTLDTNTAGAVTGSVSIPTQMIVTGKQIAEISPVYILSGSIS